MLVSVFNLRTSGTGYHYVWVCDFTYCIRQRVSREYCTRQLYSFTCSRCSRTRAVPSTTYDATPGSRHLQPRILYYARRIIIYLEFIVGKLFQSIRFYGPAMPGASGARAYRLQLYCAPRVRCRLRTCTLCNASTQWDLRRRTAVDVGKVVAGCRGSPEVWTHWCAAARSQCSQGCPPPLRGATAVG